MCTLVKNQASFLRLNVSNDLSVMAVRHSLTKSDYLIYIDMLRELGVGVVVGAT